MPPRRIARKIKKTTADKVSTKSKSKSTSLKSSSLKEKLKEIDAITPSYVSGFDESAQSESQAGLRSTRSHLEACYEEEYIVEEPTEILRYYQSDYCLNPYETDCFTFPDEYVLATKFCKLHGKKTKKTRLSWLSEEDISLPYYFTIYELNAHTTDNFTEESEYVGAIQYFNRLKGPAVPEEIIYQISDLKALEEASRTLMKFLTYSEHLIMLSKNGKEIGELEMFTKRLEIGPQLALELQIESNGVIQDVACGMKSVSRIMMPSFQTISFQHNEFIQTNDSMITNQIEMIQTSDGFELNRIEAINNVLKKTTKKFTQEEMENFVSDVSSILIQRLFILLSKADEEYKFVTLTTDCELCPIYFKHLPTTRQVVCGNIINILGLKKEIHFSADKIFEDHIYCNKAGRILSQYPIGFPIVYRMFELVMYQKTIKEVATRKKKELVWQNDLELWSKYQSRKQNLFTDYNSYVQHNSDLRAILSDFMQSVLIHAPRDIIEYANEYFTVFK